ncbi:transcriptional regulator [Alteromonas sp. KUL42]|uniref:cupin domain-containing protein n=1 Tax=Alteromonas sp. KUL42 TaxID=2480797 RepID=UPI001035CD31|nr:cupin domain-containing protein [Alteromonas sp. KUL42]TAP38535.1 anti-sigma factor [Alteromonas sp. KUL42]GEA05799.1 transcriptional regulator [Alteromonas sp. KUL42]
MIKFHPTAEQLKEFVEGKLSPAIALMVAAHCDMCSQCSAFVEKETEEVASKAFTEPTLALDDSFNSASAMSLMMSQIMQMPAAHQADGGLNRSLLDSAGNRLISKETSSKTVRINGVDVSNGVERTTSIELDGRVFTLPKTLHRYIEKTGNWSGLVGKLWQAPVDLGNQGVANFIFMGSGGSVPEHTHRGTEYTLVIDGEFSDGLSHYDTGDFIYMDGEKTHTPKAEGNEGCLVFSIVDQPLHFTSGLARLLNPFSHLFFR